MLTASESELTQTTIVDATEVLPRYEARNRQHRCIALLEKHAPEAGGLLIFSRINIYYLTGTMGNGVLWLPKEGKPVLLVRHGVERCKLESPLEHIYSFRSYSELPTLLEQAEGKLASTVAVEFNGLTWQLGNLIQKKLPDVTFCAGDSVLTLCRAVKSEWELQKLRLAGARHHQCLHNELPYLIRPGMSEREISHTAWGVFFKHGHCGIMRMNAFGEEIFLGHVAAGDSGNYPSHFNGPLGLRGEHPAAPVMGYAGQIWKAGSPLAVDIGFCLEGYHTDKTQLYWAGPANTIPDEVRRAQDACIEIQQRTAEKLQAGIAPSLLYHESLKIAEKYNFSEGYMGLGKNKVSFLGHGIGLGIDEFPVLANKFDAPVEIGNVIALEPKIGIAGIGMVGVENTFEVTADGAKCITGNKYDILCVE